MILTYPWKICNLLGGLLILLDASYGGMIPLGNKPNRPKPLTNGAAGALISSVQSSLPSAVGGLSSLTGSNSQINNHPVQQQVPQHMAHPPSPQHHPQQPASPLPVMAPAAPSSPIGVLPVQPPVPVPGSTSQVSSQQYSVAPAPSSLSSGPSTSNQSHPPQTVSSQPGPPPSPSIQTAAPPPQPAQAAPAPSPSPPSSSSPSSVTIGLGQRPPLSQTALGNAQGHLTYSQHGGGSNDVVLVLQQSLNQSLGPDASIESIGDGLDQVLAAVNPQPSQVAISPQQVSEQITTSNFQAIQNGQTIEQNVQVSTAPVPSHPQHPPSSPEVDEDENHPPFNLEEYLAQANLYYSTHPQLAPPVANVPHNDLIPEPAKPNPEVIPQAPPAPVSSQAPQPVPSELAAPPIQNSHVQNQNLFPSVTPVSISLSTSTGTSTGETITIVTTAGNMGSDSFHTFSSNNTATPALQTTVETIAPIQPQEPSVVISENVPPHPQLPPPQAAVSANPPMPATEAVPATSINVSEEENLSTEVVGNEEISLEILEEENSSAQSLSEEPAPNSHAAPVKPVVPQQQPQQPPPVPPSPIQSLPNQHDHSIPSGPLPPLMSEEQPQNVFIPQLTDPIPNTDHLQAPPPHDIPPPHIIMPSLEQPMPPMPAIAVQPSEQTPEVVLQAPPAPILSANAPESPLQSEAAPSVASEAVLENSQENNQVVLEPTPLEEPILAPIPPGVDIQTVVPVPIESLPQGEPPSNIIFEATITNANDLGGFHIPAVESPDGNGHPAYVYVPLNIPPEAQGTLTISAVPLEVPNNNDVHQTPPQLLTEVQPAHATEEEEEEEEYPPFNVEQYLQQAALFLGSPIYDPSAAAAINEIDHYHDHHDQESNEAFQSSLEHYSDETDDVIQVIPPPTFNVPIQDDDNNLIHESHVPLQVAPYHGGHPSPSEEQNASGASIPLVDPPQHIDQEPSQIVPPEPQVTISVPAPIPEPPLSDSNQIQHEEQQIFQVPEAIDDQFAFLQPVVSHQPSHIAPPVEHNNEHLSSLEEPIEEQVDELSLLNSSALEALAAESDETSEDNSDQQSFIPVYLLSVNSEGELQQAPDGNPTLTEEGENFITDEIQWSNFPGFPDDAAPVVPHEDTPSSTLSLIPQPRKNDSVERSRPSMIGRPMGMIGRPSSLGITPMHSYIGGKLHNYMGALPLAQSSEDSKSIQGPFLGFNNKNQNNGSLIVHDNKNPQNGMMSLMGNTIFNSHVSGDQPQTLAVPANAASFIMAQGQKLPFHLSPSFESLLQTPQASPYNGAYLNGANTLNNKNNNFNSNFGNLNTLNLLSNANSNDPAPAQVNSSQMYANYYNPQESVKNATVLIQNGLMRPLVSPVFLIVNTQQGMGGDQRHQYETDIKNLPDESQFNSTNNVSYVTIASDSSIANGVRKEQQNITGNIFFKRTANKGNSIVGGASIANFTEAAMPILATEEEVNNKLDTQSSNEDIIADESNKIAEVAALPLKEEGIEDMSVKDKIAEALKLQGGDHAQHKLNQHKIADDNEGEMEEDFDEEDEEEEEIVEEEGVKTETVPLPPQPQQPKPQAQMEPSKVNPAKVPEKDQGQKALPQQHPLEANNDRGKQPPAPQQQQPPQQAPPPRGPPPRDQGPPQGGPQGPSLPQPPPAPQLVGLPPVPDALSVPSALGEIAIPEPSIPNINTPSIPVPSVSIPSVPKPMGDTKGSGKGPGSGASSAKAKPSKKPQQNSSKGNGASPPPPLNQQSQQPTNIAPSNYPPPMPSAPLAPPQENVPQHQPPLVPAPMMPSNPIQEEMIYNSNVVAENDEDEDDNSYDEDEKFNGASEEVLSIPSIPEVPSPTIEKALPGKYGSNGNGKPSVVPSLAAFSAPYTNSPAPSSGSGSSSNANNNNNNNNNQPCSCSPSNNNDKNNNNQPSGGSNSKPKPAPLQPSTQIEEEIETDDEHSNVRPPRPNKPKRPSRPHKGSSKKPKPNEKNAEKLKETGDREEHEGIEHIKLVNVVSSAHNLHSTTKDVPQEEEEEDEGYEEGEEAPVREEDDSDQNRNPMGPIKVTFVTNSGEKDDNFRPNGLTGPIKVTFVTTNKNDPKPGPVKVTFALPSADQASPTSERETQTMPLHITLVPTNTTKLNETVAAPLENGSEVVEPEPSAPVKQSLLTSVTWFGWEIPALNWNYFTDLFNNIFGRNFRTNAGIFTCDESDDDSSILRSSELDVDYLCGGEDLSRAEVDSNVCNMFCEANGFFSGVCIPQKSCLCYMTEDKNFAIKLDRLQEYSSSNQTERVPSTNALEEASESSCQSCSCLKSCQSHGKYVGYCSKSCHCGVPWYNENPNVQPT